MANPLLIAWFRLVADPDRLAGRGTITPEARQLHRDEAVDPAGGIILVLRRMRYPIILLILIFTISVFGLTMIPGVDAEGRPVRMSPFDALYFVSYTATTIGFGETPHTFTTGQRMWATVVIFLSVLGWAYAIGSLLALTQDRAFRRALSRRRVSRQVRHLTEPFHILVGYGMATRRVARALDDLGHRFVVLDHDEGRVSMVDLDAYHADVPALVGNAKETRNLVLSGLAHPLCEGIVTMTGDENANLDVVMTASLLRPGLPVIARATSPRVAARMRAFGAAHVVNPLDRFGNHLRILARSPSAYRLMTWLTSAPGSPLPRLRPAVPQGSWVVAGTGPFASEIVRDLRREGLEVTVAQRSRDLEAVTDLAGDRDRDEDSDAEMLRAAGIESAVGFVAATDDDTTSLWLLDAAHRVNPSLFTVALEHRVSNVPLYEALHVSFAISSAELVGREIMGRLANPGLFALLAQIPHLGEEWSREVIHRLVSKTGSNLPELWLVEVSPGEAPALQPWLSRGDLLLGDLMRSPVDRTQRLAAVPLAVLREDTILPGPDDDVVLRPDDQILLASGQQARQALDATLSQDATAHYVIDDHFVPSGWVWRKLTRSG